MYLEKYDIGASNTNTGSGFPAFPTAEGFGADSTEGGRGGFVYIVDSTADVVDVNDGMTTLRECVEDSFTDQQKISAGYDGVDMDARTCVFAVGGYFDLDRSLVIRDDKITIAGQTSPTKVVLRNNAAAGNYGGTLIIQASDVIVRYITARVDQGTQPNNIDGMAIGHSSKAIRNIILDHVSVSFSIDELITASGDTKDYTIQRSMFSYPLHWATHQYTIDPNPGQPIRSHGFGPMLTTPNNGRASFHHNLMAHADLRNPLIDAGDGVIDIVNNVAYNYGWGLHTQNIDGQDLKINAVKNFYKRGPNSTSHRYEIIHGDRFTGGDMELYLEGNIGPYRSEARSRHVVAALRTNQGGSIVYDNPIPQDSLIFPRNIVHQKSPS